MSAHQPIDRNGIIGDLQTVALVGMDGSIDFCCFPHFDSPSIFAKLLDHRRGGSFRLAPTLEEPRHKQIYLPDTNVLFTRFLSEGGVAEVSDFMAIDDDDGRQRIVRRAKTVRGELRFRMVCDPQFDYARASHKLQIDAEGALFISDATAHTPSMALRLRTNVPLTEHNGAAVADFSLRAGENATFVLEEAQPGVMSPSTALNYTASAFKRTVAFWRSWVARSSYRGRWREVVNRSALTLKLLTSKKHGSIVAAPTFGLPEHIGGVRNWDYRYCWIRDGSFTLYGLMRLGFTDEAAAFMRWVEARCAELNPDGSLQIMYGIDGRHDLKEEILTHLDGYLDSKPVRIGNGAFDQVQLDIYGELMDSVYLYDKYGQPISHDLWQNLRRLIDWVCIHWREPDEGIWETRGGKKEFLFSRVMCWAALDRAIRLATKRSFPSPLDRWREVRDEIYMDIFENFWSAKRKAFVQSKGSEILDASTLLMPLIKFISPTDPRWLSTLRAIEQDLVDDSLVYRYRTHEFGDGLTGHEGTFCICSFWYAECLARSGDLAKARYYFEKMLGYANHLGLFPEELGPASEHLGNFPQAFTHLGLISAAYYLDRELSSQRGGS
jgi:GH15 family glucan-1,4-alpha-glucosidase